MSVNPKSLANLKRLPKGVSGNPAGRPAGSKGLASRVRDATEDGKLPVDYLVKVVAGGEKATPRERIQAAALLLERGFGKSLEVSAEITLPPESATDAEIFAAEALESLAKVLRSESESPSSVPPSALDPARASQS